MGFRDRPVAVWAFPLAMLVLAVLVLGSDAAGIATRLRGILFDAYQHSAPRTYEDPRAKSGFGVHVLDIDQASLTRFGPWPWPRAALAKLTNELKEAGAAVVVFDFPIDQPDSVSPRNLLAEVPAGPQYDAARTALSQMPSPDDAFAAALRSEKSVTGFTLGTSTVSRAPQLKIDIAFTGTKAPFAFVPQFDQASGPLEEIEQASAGLGALNLVPDKDGKVRRVHLIFQFADKPVASLDAEAARVAEGQPSILLHGDDGDRDLLPGRAGISSVSFGTTELPTATDGSVWIAYSGPNAARDLSAASLDENAIEKDALKNAIVYVGAPDDVAATPDGVRNVADIHAEAMENILLGDVLRRPASAGAAEVVCLAILGLATVFLFARFGVVWAGAFTAAGIAIAAYASFRLYSADRVLFDALGPGLGLVAVFAAGAGARTLEIARSRAKLRSAFADALPFDAIEQISRKPQLLKLEGENRTVTYLACGVRGFQALATSFRDDPAAFTRLMRRVLTPLMDEVLAHGGTIDRLTNEGFTAFWNAPLDDPEHAIHACEAASRMTELMARVNDGITRERRIDGTAFTPVEIGIGVSTGPAIAGGFAAHGRTAYSVTGDCTAVAERILSLSSQYGPAVIVSETTRKASERGFAFLEVDYIACGPLDEPMKLYAMLGNPVVRASPKFRALSTFHEHIFQSLRTQQWAKTRALIEQCRKLSGASPRLYDLHLARVTYFETNPPGTDWDGAFRPILK